MSSKQKVGYKGIPLVSILLLLLCTSQCIYGKGMKSKPFVKWAGGKGQLIEQLDALLPACFSTTNVVYVEPFDRVIKHKPAELINELNDLQEEYYRRETEAMRRKMFLEKRDRYNAHDTKEVETAALFIFLNRTCFNGLYRVNSKGLYNVPFGKAARPLICDEETLRADSAVLQKVEILCGDYSQVTNVVAEKSFFYFDPPYRPLTKTAAFTAYSKGGFGDDEQERLADFCRALDAKGDCWLLSNSDPHNVSPDDMFFEELYKGFDIHRVSASRMINSKAEGRGKITELAIRNYKE